MSYNIYIKKVVNFASRVKRKIRLVLRFKKPLLTQTWITIGLSLKCDIKCIFCLAHSPLIMDEQEKLSGTTWQLGKSSIKYNDYLEFKKFKEIVDDLQYLKPNGISLSGNGEILLYPYLVQAISYIKSNPKLKDVPLDLSTNAVTLNGELSAELIRLGINIINFSINASGPESYEAMHSVNGQVFYKVTNNIKNFVSLTEKTDKNKPDITATFVICKKNYHQIKEMISLCDYLRIKKVGFRNMYFCKGKIAYLEDYILSPNDKRELENLILDTLIEAKSKKIFTNLNPFLSILRKGSSDNFLTQVHDAYNCQIHPNGIVNPYDFPYLMGNIYKNSLFEIWHSKGYVRFRNMIKKKAHNKEFSCNRPFCFRCNLANSELDNCNIIF